MIGTIRKHQTWLWGVIIVAVIVSFVVYFTPGVQLGGRGGGGRGFYGTIKGRPISAEEFGDAYREIMLLHLFTYGDWPDRNPSRRYGFDMERETRNRLLLIEKMRDLNIQVGEEAVSRWITETPAFQRREQRTFDPNAYAQFLTNRLADGRLGQADFYRFIRHEIGIQHLLAVAGVSGRLITPREAQAQYREENEQIEASAAVFSSSQYRSNVVVAPDGLAQYYTNRLAYYREPEKVRVTYVKFEVTNFVGEAEAKLSLDTNLSSRLDAIYLQQGAGAFTDTNGVALSPEAAKARMREQLRQQEALMLARRKATEFANALFDVQPHKAENLDSLAAAKGLVPQTTEPFAEIEGPRPGRFPEAFARVAFKLSEEEPFTASPIVGADGVYIVGLKQRIASALPSLDAIRDRVTEDYRRSRALELAQEAGRAFAAQLTNQLAAGKTFEAACAEAKVEVVNLPPFSSQTRSFPAEPRLDVGQVREVAALLPAGKTSEFTPSRQGGFVLHVLGRREVPEAQLKAELPGFLNTLRRSRQYEVFSDWVRQEAELAQLTMPSGEKKVE